MIAEVEALHNATGAVEADDFSEVHIGLDQGEAEAQPIYHVVPTTGEVHLNTGLLDQHKTHDRGVAADDHARARGPGCRRCRR